MTIVTTAAPYRPDKGDQGPGAPYNGGAKFYQVYSGDTSQQHDLRISHIGYDRMHTTAEDSGTWFPLPALLRAARRAVSAPWRRASMAHRPTAATASRWRPMRRRSCAAVAEDGADAAILVPNCPVCHQTCSLVARHLEANGIPTVVMGCAKDIVEHAAVPRFLFSDFPLGNSAGRPHDVASQDARWNWRCACWSPHPGRARRCVAAALERGCVVEARLPEPRPHRTRGTGPPPPRVRRAEGGRAGAARGEAA